MQPTVLFHTHFTDRLKNDNGWSKEANMEDRKFKIQVSIVTNTISQSFAAGFTVSVFTTCPL